MIEAWTETVDSVDETDTVEESVEESVDDAAGIPDEPEPFVEELRAAGDLPETGDPRVDEVLSALADLQNLPAADHVAVYDQAHRGLQDALANLDQG